MATFPALLDTNVLFGFHLNDVIFAMAERGLFRPLWSEQILTELSENLIEHGLPQTNAERRINAMRRSFPGDSVSAYDIEIVHPDQFLLDQLDLYPGSTVGVLQQLIADYSNPTLEVADLLVRLADAGVPEFASAVRRYL